MIFHLVLLVSACRYATSTQALQRLKELESVPCPVICLNCGHYRYGISLLDSREKQATLHSGVEF